LVIWEQLIIKQQIAKKLLHRMNGDIFLVNF